MNYFFSGKELTNFGIKNLRVVGELDDFSRLLDKVSVEE